MKSSCWEPTDARASSRFRTRLSGQHATRLHYFAFDLPYLDGYDLRQVPLVERKKLLEALLQDAPETLRYSSHVQGSGEAFLKGACDHELEGIVSKRAQSAVPGRAVPRLAESEVQCTAGARHRRLHRPAGQPQRFRRAPSRHSRQAGHAAICREGRDGLQ